MQKKIFIIEDNKDLLDIYSIRFKNAGYKVHAESDGINGLLHLEEIEPDAILLDIMMPHMNGFEVLENLKKNLCKKQNHIPVIIWSNLSQQKDIQKALDIGAELYLKKSDYSGADLVEKVTEFINKKHSS